MILASPAAHISFAIQNSHWTGHLVLHIVKLLDWVYLCDEPTLAQSWHDLNLSPALGLYKHLYSLKQPQHYLSVGVDTLDGSQSKHDTQVCSYRMLLGAVY